VVPRARTDAKRRQTEIIYTEKTKEVLVACMRKILLVAHQIYVNKSEYKLLYIDNKNFNAGVELIKSLMKQYNIPLMNILRRRSVVSDITHTANSTQCSDKNFPYIPSLDALRDGEPFPEINSGQAFDIGEDYPYINEVKTLKQFGIVKGDGKGYLKPSEYITREEAMLIAYRIIELLQN